LLEPKAPPPSKRLEAVRALTDAGIRVGVNLMPVLPGLTDSPRSMEAVARAAAAHGATSLYGNVLFLMPSAAKAFMPFLEREFPRLVKRYRKLYARSAYLSGEYKQDISRLVTMLRARYGLEGKREEAPLARKYEQLGLAFSPGAEELRDSLA